MKLFLSVFIIVLSLQTLAQGVPFADSPPAESFSITFKDPHKIPSLDFYDNPKLQGKPVASVNEKEGFIFKNEVICKVIKVGSLEDGAGGCRSEHLSDPIAKLEGGEEYASSYCQQRKFVWSTFSGKGCDFVVRVDFDEMRGNVFVKKFKGTTLYAKPDLAKWVLRPSWKYFMEKEVPQKYPAILKYIKKAEECIKLPKRGLRG